MSTSFRSRNNFSTFEAFKNVSDLSKPIQQHLIKVYATLATLCLLAAVGSFAHVTGLFLFGVCFISISFGILYTFFGVLTTKFF